MTYAEKHTLSDQQYNLRYCVVELTRACNLRCHHCCVLAGKSRENELSTAKLVEVFEQLVGLGCKKVSFSGGEPLLRKDWPVLVAEATSLGLSVGLMTNGSLFGVKEAQLARASGLKQIGFSVDGVGDVHDRARGLSGTFEGVSLAIEAARSQALPFGAVTQINRANLHSLHEIHGFLMERGTAVWRVQIGQSLGRMRNNEYLSLRTSDLPEVFETLSNLVSQEDMRIVPGDSLKCSGFADPVFVDKDSEINGVCHAGRSAVTILSDGSVVGCQTVMFGPAGSQCGIEGNVNTRSLSEIWLDPDAFDFHRNWEPERLGGSCGECDYSQTCRGGCPGSWIETGDGYENLHCVLRATLSNKRGKTTVIRSLTAATAFTAACATFLSLSSCATVACPNCNSDSDSDTDTDTDTDTDSDTDTDADTDTDTDSDTDTEVDAGSDASTGDGGVGDAGIDGG